MKMLDGDFCRWVPRTASEWWFLQTFVHIKGLADGYEIVGRR